MSLFSKNKNKTVDFTGKYDRQKERMENIQTIVNKAEGKPVASMNQETIPRMQSPNQNSFGFLGQMAAASMNSQSQIAPSYSASEDSDDKRKKLAQRLMDITEKLEEISTQLYHLQQRVELLERRTKGSGFE